MSLSPRGRCSWAWPAGSGSRQSGRRRSVPRLTPSSSDCSCDSLRPKPPRDFKSSRRAALRRMATAEPTNLLDHPARALADGIIVTPTLLKLLPLPVQRLIGNLSDRKQVLVTLGSTCNASEALHTRDLAQRLSEAAATIKALLSGEIDAVVDSRTSTPLPKGLYDFETLRFLAVNDAAVGHYGDSREEFLLPHSGHWKTN